MGGMFATNDKSNLIGLSAIAALILFIAFFNYFNITSALLRTRTKEMGLRKIFGSSKGKSIVQMAVEALVILLFSILISGVLVFMISQSKMHPSLQFQISGLFFVLAIVIMLLFTILAGALFGGYFIAISTVKLLKGRGIWSSERKFSFGKIILTAQFGISAGLIMVSLIMISQIKYFTEKELGLNTEDVLVAKFRGRQMSAWKKPFKDALGLIPEIQSVSFGPGIEGSFSSSPLSLPEWPKEQAIRTDFNGVDYEFNKVVNLDLVDGRFFSESISQDSSNSILINEKLAGMLALENPVGQKVIFVDGAEFEIIGIFRDFHYQSLHHEIGPMALRIWQFQPIKVMIRFESQSLGETIGKIEDTWKEVFQVTGIPFDYYLLDDQLELMYEHEREFASMLNALTVLAIFVALLGLYGLSSIHISIKMKQIGIRRVLGAELNQIAQIVGRKYLAPVLIGFLFSIPVVIVIMNKWLESFAYRIGFDFGTPLISLFAVGLVTVCTLGIQVYRVMTINPARILRDE